MTVQLITNTFNQDSIHIHDAAFSNKASKHLYPARFTYQLCEPSIFLFSRILAYVLLTLQYLNQAVLYQSCSQNMENPSPKAKKAKYKVKIHKKV